MSEKRILPAFLLAAIFGLAGLHRFYAGRFVSGLIQLLASATSFFWLQRACVGLLQITTIEEMQNWLGTHRAPLGPLLLFTVVSFVPLIDCLRLAAGKFKDGHGLLITQWRSRAA